MKVKLMTDAPNHNLALMKISTYHKGRGDEVFLGGPEDECDTSYGSWMFNYHRGANFSGGSGQDPSIRLPSMMRNLKPDYDLFPTGHSLGYTWEYCPRKCGFCVVPRQNNPKIHRSIWKFHDPKFKKICLLNNNTFSDPKWLETFEELWDAKLTVLDEGGYDLRLLDEEKMEALNRTNFFGMIHFAWDCAEDEKQIRRGMEILMKNSKRPLSAYYIFVLVGYPRGKWLAQEDFYRCQVIRDHGLTPFIMVYNRVVKSKDPRMIQLNRFFRMVNRTFYWRKVGFDQAWKEYKAR